MTDIFIAFFLIVATVSGIGIAACILASFLLHLPSLVRQHTARISPGRLANAQQPGEPITSPVSPPAQFKHKEYGVRWDPEHGFRNLSDGGPLSDSTRGDR